MRFGCILYNVHCMTSPTEERWSLLLGVRIVCENLLSETQLSMFGLDHLHLLYQDSTWISNVFVCVYVSDTFNTHYTICYNVFILSSYFSSIKWKVIRLKCGWEEGRHKARKKGEGAEGENTVKEKITINFAVLEKSLCACLLGCFCCLV